MASTNPTIKSFLSGNAKFAESFSPPPTIAKILEGLKSRGGKGTVILTCSDPRTAPESFMPLATGAPAVVRNAGGRASDAMRSLYVLNALSALGLVVVVHHTDCGVMNVNEQDVKKSVKGLSGEGMDFGTFTDVEKSTREDVKFIKDDPLFAKQGTEVVGMVYDLIGNGKLTVLE